MSTRVPTAPAEQQGPKKNMRIATLSHVCTKKPIENKQYCIDIDIPRNHARVANTNEHCCCTYTRTHLHCCTHFCLFLSEMASHSGTFARAWGTKGPKSPWIRCRGPCLNFGTISMSSSSAMNSNSAAVNFPKPPASAAGIATSSKRAAQQQQSSTTPRRDGNLHSLFFFLSIFKKLIPDPRKRRCSMY